MTGTGTQADPYMITTVAEFRSMNDSTAYYKLANDLDVNDSEWATGWARCGINCKEFDGDGHEIRNIVYNGSNYAIYAASNIIRFKNVNFVNVVIITGKFFNLAYSSSYAINCQFSIICSTRYELFSSGWFGECSFQIQGSSGTICQSPNGIQNCFFNLDMNITRNSGASSLYLISRSNGSETSDVNIYVRGKVVINGTTSMDWYFFYDCPNMSYIACEIENNSSSNIKFYVTTEANSGVCFYDSELAGITTLSQTNVYALTTAQCKDKDYLNSIGFVVV